MCVEWCGRQLSDNHALPAKQGKFAKSRVKTGVRAAVATSLLIENYRFQPFQAPL
jgi:hypothetical protein